MDFVTWVINHHADRSGSWGDFARDLFHCWETECLFGVSTAEDVLEHIRLCHGGMCDPAYRALADMARRYGTPLAEDEEWEEWL